MHAVDSLPWLSATLLGCLYGEPFSRMIWVPAASKASLVVALALRRMSPMDFARINDLLDRRH
jgi:hypothetical protein